MLAEILVKQCAVNVLLNVLTFVVNCFEWCKSRCLDICLLNWTQPTSIYFSIWIICMDFILACFYENIQKNWIFGFKAQAHSYTYIRTCFLIQTTVTFKEEYFLFVLKSLSFLIVKQYSIDYILVLLFRLLIVYHS